MALDFFKDKKYSADDIIGQLRDMDAPQDSIVLVHSSIKAVGTVEGGAEGLLDVLIGYFTQKGGLLCIPTHTWHNLGKEITMDMSDTDNCLGVLSTVALCRKDGIRSENPCHSLKVFGDRVRAEEFISNEPIIKSPTSPIGCYGKLCSEGGCVLLIGVSQSRNTYLHAVDEILGIGNRMADKPIPTCIKKENGELIKRDLILYESDFTDDISNRFPKYETAFRYHRCIKDGFIGNAPAQLCDAKGMKEVVELIVKNSGGIDPLGNESPIPQKWYCGKL